MDPVNDRGRIHEEQDTVIDSLNNPAGAKFAGEATSTKQDSLSDHSLLGYTVLAVGIALFIRFFIAAPYIVEGSSMEPAFFDWQYLIIDKLAYDISLPQRGDVIVFKLPFDQKRSLIKRIIGLPGETVRLNGGAVTIINEKNPEGFVLEEPYIDPKNASTGDRLEVQLGDNEYFVLGDNRRVSADSRIWGKLPEADISGRVDVRLFPFSMITVLPGKVEYKK